MKRFRKRRLKRIRRAILAHSYRIEMLTDRIELADPASDAAEVLRKERSAVWWKRNTLYSKLIRLKEAA